MLKCFLIIFVIFSSNFTLAKKVLIVLSGENKLILKNGQRFSTGFYLNELMIPVQKLLRKNYQLVFATPKGKIPTLDLDSDAPKYFSDSHEYKKSTLSLKKLKLLDRRSSSIKSLSFVIKEGLESYDGIFIPGGHAPMIDLAFNKNLGIILKHFNKFKKPTALVCHGPVALLSTLKDPKSIALSMKSSSKWIYKGYKMTVFSNTEEAYAEKKKLKGKVPYYPQNSLQRAGGKVLIGKDWQQNVIIDRELITGQNPRSDKQLADIFIEQMQKFKRAK